MHSRARSLDTSQFKQYPGSTEFPFSLGGGLFVYLKIRREHIWCLPLCIPFFDPVLSSCIIFLPKLGKFPLF